MKKTFLYPVAIVTLIIISMAFLPAKKGSSKRSAVKSARAMKAVRVAVKKSDSSAYYIVIDKSDYELKVYDDEGWYATYPIVFGSKDLSDKMKEGDRKTPNGKFKIILKKIHNKWGPELLLDYPGPSDVEKFNERKKKGLIPKTAKIGGGIAIHATRPEEEWAVDNYYNWTDGCISVKYSEMKDLYSYIQTGTEVTIQP